MLSIRSHRFANADPGRRSGRVLVKTLAAGLLAFAAVAAASPDRSSSVQVEQILTRLVEQSRRRGDAGELAAVLARRADHYQTLGHRQLALADLEEAGKLARQDGAPSLLASVLGALGQAYFLVGRSEEAATLLGDALARARAIPAPRLVAAVQNDLGNLLAATGKTQDALAAYVSSAASARGAGDGLLAAEASLNAARLQWRHGKFVRTLVDAALADLPALPDTSEKALQLAGAGELLRQAARSPLDRGMADAAAAALDQSARSAERANDPRGVANASGYRAELALDAGDLAGAMAHNERALFEAQRSGAAETIFQWQWQRARLLEHGKRDAEALAAYRRTLDSLEAVKSDIAADVWARRESMREVVGPAYLGYANLLTRRAAAGDREASSLALREAQGVLERFKTVELEDYFRDDCVANYLSRSRPVEQTAPRTAVIYPILLPDRLALLVTIGAEIHQVVVPVGAEALGREAVALRSLLEKRATYQYLPHARKLYDWVIRPLEPLLARGSVETLVVLPDGALRNIPFGALHDGSRFLIERYAVAVAPSLTLIEPKPLARAAPAMLSGGLTEAVQGFAALPYVGIELDQLNSTGTGEQLRDQAFTTRNFEHELATKSFSVVHVASHAQFDSDSRRSFLLTFDGKLTIDRLEGQMKVNRFRDEPVELLFLSACQTAAGDERAALGLAGVAVKAGARSALATLWHINDQASSLLVGEFYRQLGQSGTTKAQALQRAQQAMLGDLRYRHPGYWSPFMLIGNWL